MKHKTPLLLYTSVFAVSLAVGFVPVQAQAVGKPHQHKAMATDTASTRAYKQAMEVMHQHMQIPLSGDADVDFVRGMIPHHQGAVAMAKVQLAYGKDEAIKSFSRWVITAQTQEIGFMEQWLRRRDNGRSIPGATDYYGEAMQAMHHAMMIDYTGDADLDFVNGMIAHHQGAVEMARILIAQGNDPELRKLAEDIFNAQEYEIAWQRDWLAHRSEHPAFPSLVF